MAFTKNGYKYEGKDNIDIDNFLNDQNLTTNLSVDEFLSFSANGNSNLNLIWSLYDLSEKSENEFSYNSGSLPYIKPNTTVYLPIDKIDVERSLIYGSNQVLSNQDFTAYQPNYIELIESDGYIKADDLSLDAGNYNIQVINENIRVWIYIRSVEKLVNLSPFVRSVSTSKSGDAGTFNITLDPVVDLDDPIFIYENTLNFFNISDKDGHVLDFFEKKVQQNDVVFIRYERLDQESIRDVDLKIEIPLSNLGFSKNKIGGTSERVWDMIGLVDNINSSYSASSTDKQLTMNGRDLMKVLTDDGAYFLAYRYVEGKDDKNKFVWGGGNDNSWFKRNVVSGAYDYFFAYDVKKIPDALGFIINHLSNIGLVDNSLFGSFKNKSSILDVSGADKDYLEKKDVNGIWQIIKLKVDSSLDNRVYAGNALGNPDGTLSEFFNQICQNPFVEFWGDTYGSYFNFTVRKPPFTQSAITDLYNHGYYIDIEEKDLLSYNLNYDQRSYSSYELEPDNQFFGAEDGLFKAIVPVLFLSKFAENFGNKRLSLKDSYLFLDSLYGEKQSSLKNSQFINNFLEDLKYVINSNCYLPFTRTGSLTINGDRRIKKGTFVLNKATNELFHVTGVSNSASFSKNQIDRTTILNVERGMVPAYLNARSKDTTLSPAPAEDTYTYFNIVNTDLFIHEVKQRLESTTGQSGITSSKVASTNYSVNNQAFEFFFKRKQFN